MKEQPLIEVTEVPVGDLVPYARNAKIHTNEQVDQIVKSIEEFGFNDPIGVWEDAEGELEIVEGHGRVLAAKKLGLDVVPVIYLNHLSDEQRRAYTHVHNQLTLNSDFDYDKLLDDLADLDGFDFEGYGFVTGEEVEEVDFNEAYSQNVGTVTYEPKETSWAVSDLYSFDDKRIKRLRGLIDQIGNEQLKEMLCIRLDWFCEFSFGRIADYYAYQATPEEQRAFEALGLVLLDRDQLIENGFASIVESVTQ